jgi:hypothetical protein
MWIQPQPSPRSRSCLATLLTIQCRSAPRSIFLRSSRKPLPSTAIWLMSWASSPIACREPIHLITQRHKSSPISWPASVPMFTAWCLRARPSMRPSASPKIIPRRVSASPSWLYQPASMRPAPSTSCARLSRATRKRVSRKIFSTLPSGTKLPPRSFSATLFLGWRPPGRKR